MHTKFEVSMLTHYEEIKCNIKFGIGMVGVSGVTQGHQQHSHALERLRFPIQLQQKVCIYLVPSSSYSKLSVKSRRF